MRAGRAGSSGVAAEAHRAAPVTRARRRSEILNLGADVTVAGGRKGIVTTLYFMLARKPDTGSLSVSVAG